MSTGQPYQLNTTLHSLVAGDAKGFSEIYSSYYLPIYYFAKKFVGDAVVAEDVTAETFSKLWQEAEQKREVKNVKAFLHVTAKNNCLDKLKMEKTHQEKHREILYLQQEDLRAALNAAELKAAVMDSIYAEIEKLPPKSRMIFKMAFFEGMKTGEIAKKLGLNENTVTNQKVSALKKLRLALKDQEWMILLVLLLAGRK